jgi:hypothetical protein
MNDERVGTSPDTVNLALARAEQRIAELEARLLRLEQVATTPDEVSLAPAAPAAPAEVGASALPDSSVSLEEVSTRRGLFKVAGAVASAAVAHSLFAAPPAAAADGQNLVIGQSNTSSTETSLTKGTNGGAALVVTNSSTTGVADGVRGVSDSNTGAGVAGSSTNGYGVIGTTSFGYAVYSQGRFGLGAHLTSPGPPTSGTYELGDLFRDNVGNLWVCVVAGLAPSVARFRKAAGPATAGQLHLLDVPTRVYDSRNGGSPLIAGATRTVSLATAAVGGGAVVPSGAVSATVNLTLVNTVTAGWLAVYRAGSTFGGHSSINWYTNGQIQCNVVISSIDSLAQVTVRAGGATSASTDFLIDVVGYTL